MQKDIKFTLVSTVFNEASRLTETLEELKKQILQPSEIIVADAGSTDGTYEILEEWGNKQSFPVKIILEQGCNIARGRNLAIKAATNNIIASTDFGCKFHPRWLESIINPFQDEKIEVVGGNYSVNEKSISSLASKAEYIIQNGYNLPLDATFTVSSRSIAYKKYVWEKIGGYPEWLTLAADDSTFWKLIRKQGFKYTLVKNSYVYWTRHNSLIGYTKEAGRYGLGDGESRTNFKNFWSHIIETTLRLFFYCSIVLSILNLIHPAWILLGLPGLRSFYRTFTYWLNNKSSKYHVGIFLYSLYMIERLRFAYLKGYTKGWLFKNNTQRENAEKLANQLKNSRQHA